ncbi:unnamed protein product [Closterium sp. NIES-53]
MAKISRGNLALLKALRVSLDIARSQLNPIDGLHDKLRDVQGTLAVLTKSLLIPLSTNSDPMIGAAGATLLVPEVGSCLEEMGFRTSSCDESRFLKGEGEKLVLFLVYVDDILLFSSSMKEIQKVLQQLMKNFKCKTLGEVKYYLGMHVERDLDHRWLKLHQEKFIQELGEKYGIEN